jgi:hypothetical protein
MYWKSFSSGPEGGGDEENISPPAAAAVPGEMRPVNS